MDTGGAGGSRATEALDLDGVDDPLA